MRYHLALTAALALQVSAAHADSIVALVGEDILATIDGRTAKTTGLVKIDGLGPVLGIDVRPSDGQLYALASDGTIATIDPGTGKATAKSRLDMLPRADIQIAVDFNPVADKLRIIGADGTNLRADVDSGKVTEDKSLKFAANDPAADQTPTIIAGAYSNSVKGAKGRLKARIFWLAWLVECSQIRRQRGIGQRDRDGISSKGSPCKQEMENATSIHIGRRRLRLQHHNPRTVYDGARARSAERGRDRNEVAISVAGRDHDRDDLSLDGRTHTRSRRLVDGICNGRCRASRKQQHVLGLCELCYTGLWRRSSGKGLATAGTNHGDERHIAIRLVDCRYFRNTRKGDGAYQLYHDFLAAVGVHAISVVLANQTRKKARGALRRGPRKMRAAPAKAGRTLDGSLDHPPCFRITKRMGWKASSRV